MLVQHAHLVPEVLHVGGREVPDVGVARHDAQGELLAAAADDEGRIRLLDRLRLAAGLLELVVAPVEVGELLGPEPPGDLAGLAEAPDALAGRVERDAHALVLVLVPAGADAEIEATVGDHVHRGRHVGMDRGVAVGVARDHQPEAQARRLGRQGRQQRPALEAGAIQVALDRREMIEEPGVLEGGRPVGLLPDLEHRVVGRVLWRRLDSPSELGHGWVSS